MTRNMGSADRIIRPLIAAALITLVLTGQLMGAWAVVASVIAAVFVLTSLVGFCPAYRLLGMNTCRRA